MSDGVVVERVVLERVYNGWTVLLDDGGNTHAYTRPTLKAAVECVLDNSLVSYEEGGASLITTAKAMPPVKGDK